MESIPASRRDLLINLLLLFCTLLACYGVAELTFFMIGQKGRALPVIIFTTTDPDLKIWAYSDPFWSVGDADLRKDHPYGQLTYSSNMDRDPELPPPAPEDVPHAIEIRLNKEGIRERPLDVFPPDAEITLVIGDSFCFGQGVRLQDRFSNLLEQQLVKSHHTKHMLLNACRPGAGIEMIVHILGLAVERVPNIRRVIYAYTLNDPVSDPAASAMHTRANDFMHLRRSLQERELDAWLDTPMIRWFRTRVLQRRISEQTVSWYRYLHADNPGWGQTRQAFEELDRLAHEAGADVHLVVFPIFHRLSDYPFRPAHAKLAALARDEGWGFVDLLEIFGGTDERDYWVHPTDFHPNHLAHAEVAAFLASRIDW